MRGHAMGDLGFITRSRLYDGKYRPMAVWACKCGATLEQQIPRGELNPEAVAKRASVAGWKVDSHHSSVTRCPACWAGKTKHSLACNEPINPNKVVPMIPKTEPREISQQERLRIRAILDKHFDDGAGCWLDGYSDQKAGEEAGVPWAHVTKIREAAYGPIKVDPEVAALRADMAKIAKDISTLQQHHADIAKRLEGLEKQRAAA